MITWSWKTPLNSWETLLIIANDGRNRGFWSQGRGKIAVFLEPLCCCFVGNVCRNGWAEMHIVSFVLMQLVKCMLRAYLCAKIIRRIAFAAMRISLRTAHIRSKARWRWPSGSRFFLFQRCFSEETYYFCPIKRWHNECARLLSDRFAICLSMKYLHQII